VATVRPTYEKIESVQPPKVMNHIRPLYYGRGGVVLKGRTYEFFLPNDTLPHQIPHDPRLLPVVVPVPDPHVDFFALRIYRDGYRGGTTVPRQELVLQAVLPGVDEGGEGGAKGGGAVAENVGDWTLADTIRELRRNVSA
jgi:hypothetical protein